MIVHGLVFLLGIIHKPVIEMFWSTDPLFSTPLFSAVMTQNRLCLLLRFFHLNDSSYEPCRDDPKHDRLYKLRPLVDILFEMFQSVFILQDLQ